MVFDARFSPDGRRVLTASADGTARIYDVSLARPLSELMALAHERRPRALFATEARQFIH
jgi:WD40 repeat protein